MHWSAVAAQRFWYDAAQLELENDTSQTHTEALLEGGCSPEDWRPPVDGGVAPITRSRLSAFYRMIRWLTSCGAGSSGTGGDFDVRQANAQRWLRAAAT